MSDPSVSERRIRPIQDAIAGGNWKQALQLCDKWSKKGERSDKFLAVKALAFVSQPDKSQRDRGKQEVLDLCKRTPPITEPEAIYQLQSALRSLSLQDESPKLWERALTAKKDDKDLYTRWLNQAIADNNWRSAQKATMGLRNAFPKERQYEFWNVLMCFLIHKEEAVPEKDRMLFGTLAYRMMSKAAEAIPKDEEQTSSAKSISEPEEIALLTQIFNSTGHVEDSLKLLHGGPLGIKSRLGKKDPQLVLSLLLESLEAAEKWEEALTVCQELLAEPAYQSDDRIWGLWLQARSKSTDQGLKAASDNTLDSVCAAKPIVRPAYLAKLRIQRSHDVDCDAEIDQDALLQTCKEYSEAFLEKAFCFDDLKDSLRRLDKTHHDDFMRIAEQKEGNLAQLFTLKVLYSSISLDSHGPKHNRSRELLAFACKALKLYQKSLSDAPSCPEAALLAALAILHLWTQDLQSQQILVAITILELARSKFEDYYILTVLLVQLQSHLGLLSLAMKNFAKLSIKNMQWETVGHLTLTRISTLHPAFDGTAGDLDPLLAVETGVTVLENAENALVRGIREGLRFNSYSNIYNSVQMRSDIERSLNKQISAIEERKLLRWRPGSDDHSILPPLNPSETLVDKRDSSYLPSYREEDRLMIDRYSCGAQPKDAWVSAMVLFDNLATYLKQDLASHAALATAAYENLRHLHERYSTKPFDRPILEGELTGVELSILDLARGLARAVILLNEGQTTILSPGGQQSLTDILTELSSSLNSSLNGRRTDDETRRKGRSDSFHPKIAGIYVPWWSELHVGFSQLEELNVISSFLTWTSKKLQKGGKNSKAVFGTVTKASISELQSLVTALEEQIHADARWIKSQINEPGVLGKLVDLGMARQADPDPQTDADGTGTWIWNELESGEEWETLMESLCDEATMETICGKYRESWDDALDGILVTKVRITK